MPMFVAYGLWPMAYGHMAMAMAMAELVLFRDTPHAYVCNLWPDGEDDHPHHHHHLLCHHHFKYFSDQQSLFL